MPNSIRTPRQGYTANQKRIAAAVDNEEWQRFRVSLKGLDTQSKLDALQEYYEDQTEYFTRTIENAEAVDEEDMAHAAELDLEDVRIRVDNYLKALARGGQLEKGVSLEQALAWNWCLRIRK